MDESTSIGVIELKTCVQSIVQCSPELVATLGQDYTVYAYDFSECDTPLVGQGMLSWALATASPPPESTPQHPQKLITGRVCKNILGLFSSGVKETLEVKLRLVPVPTVLQSEYLNSIERYRDLSKLIPTNFDHNEWTSFIQSNPGVMNMGGKTSPPAAPVINQRAGTNMEVVNQLLSPNTDQRTTPNPSSQPLLTENQRAVSRSGTPIIPHGEPHSRPVSRASNGQPRRRGRPPKSSTTCGNTSGYEDGTDGDDNPVPKKRAKITKADWNNNKSSFGLPSDSLRVAASTAGSLRLFRPIAMTPGPNHGSHLQEIPRAPTPVPIKANEPQAKVRNNSQTTLRRASFASQNELPRKHISPYPPVQLAPHPEDRARYTIESAHSSPDRNLSAGETPPDISSSPPVMRTASPLPSSPQCPSSPILPQMPRTDSGFMSGSVDDLFGEDDECNFTKDQEAEVEVAPKTKRAPRAPRPDVHYGFEIEEETPGPVELLPTRMPVPEPPKPKASKQSRTQAENTSFEDTQSLPPLNPATQAPSINDRRGSASAPAINPSAASQSRPSSRMLVRSASRGSLTLPAPSESDPALSVSQPNVQQTQTWCDAPQQSIEAQAPVESAQPGYRQQDAKRAAIKSKLEAAVANGEMPPFCSNCGAIETPTWRKAWSQECKGVPAYHEYSEKPGKVTAIIVLERDSEGTPTSYQLIKKSLAPGDDKSAFKEFTLCNRKYLDQNPEEICLQSQPVVFG